MKRSSFSRLGLHLFLIFLGLSGLASSQIHEGNKVRADFRPSESALELNRKLAVDGVRIGMSYSEVLNILGKPESLHWDGQATQFRYPGKHGNYIPRTVAFVGGRVIYCSGYSLDLTDGKSYHSGRDVQELLDILGNPQSFSSSRLWFPETGVVLSTGFFQREEIRKGLPIGIRDLRHPIVWMTVKTRERAEIGSKFEPWLTGFLGRWWSEEIFLGMSESKAKERPQQPGIIYEGGFVRGIANPQRVRFQEQLGWHRWATVFAVGEPRWSGHPFLMWKHPEDWQPDSRAKIEFENKIVKSIELYVEDDDLFLALREAS